MNTKRPGKNARARDLGSKYVIDFGDDMRISKKKAMIKSSHEHPGQMH